MEASQWHSAVSRLAVPVHERGPAPFCGALFSGADLDGFYPSGGFTREGYILQETRHV